MDADLLRPFGEDAPKYSADVEKTIAADPALAATKELLRIGIRILRKMDERSGNLL